MARFLLGRGVTGDVCGAVAVGLDVCVIEGMDAFDGLKPAWDAVYAADPEAHVYLSQAWLKPWLEAQRTPWFVLAARPQEPGAPYVAFLPMRIRARFDRDRGFFNDVVFAGEQFADYNGVLCRPEHEAAALAAFAQHLRTRLNWAELRLDNWRVSPRRRRLFLNGFDKVKFRRRSVSAHSAEDDIDQNVCPYVDLPADWEAFLAGLSANNRQKARRMLRKVEGSDLYRITVADADTYERDLAALLDMWRAKWLSRKGARAERIIARNHKVLLAVAREGRLFLPTFWRGDRPVAALASLVDPVKKRLLFVITGRDETFDEVPAGFALHAYSIRRAIADGLRTYDFLRGDEPYKYVFGAKDSRISTLVLTTLGKRNLGGTLDRRTLPAMMALARGMSERRQWRNAELAHRQIAEFDPENALAHYRLGVARLALGDAAGARTALQRSVEIDPKGDNAWLELAQAREALGDVEGALDAARRVADLRPDDAVVANLVWRLGHESPAHPAPVLRPARRATAHEMIARATGRPMAFDPGPRVPLDPRTLPGVDRGPPSGGRKT